MRILFLSQLVPYPVDAGPKIRIFHVLQYLASAGHEITLAALSRPEDKPEHIDHLRTYCKAIHTVQMDRSRWKNVWQLTRSLLTNQSFLITRDDVPAMRRLLASLVAENQYDAVHADQLWMAQYALLAKEFFPGTEAPMMVLDQHNAVFLIPRRLAAENKSILERALLGLEGKKLAVYETEICRKFDQVVWVTDEDRQALARHDGRINGPTIPICVDTEAEPPLERQDGAKRVTFIGGLHWLPNSQGVTWFANEVWPLIQAQVPEAVLTIIGKSPPAALRTAAEQETSIEILGYVSDPKPYLAETAAFIVPLHAGGGMRVKILHAWKLGIPVVSTTIGAEGIFYGNGRDLIIADNAQSFAESVTCLLRDSTLALNIGQAGRKSVETYYDWRKVYPAWDAIYGSARE